MSEFKVTSLLAFHDRMESSSLESESHVTWKIHDICRDRRKNFLLRLAALYYVI